MIIYLDTNVLIELIDRNRYYHHKALDFIEYLINRNITIITSAHNIITIGYVLQRQKIKNVVERLRDLATIVTLADVRSYHIHNAMERNWKDFEDAVQHEIALGESCTHLITINTKDYTLAEIDVIHIKQAMALIK